MRIWLTVLLLVFASNVFAGNEWIKEQEQRANEIQKIENLYYKARGIAVDLNEKLNSVKRENNDLQEKNSELLEKIKQLEEENKKLREERQKTVKPDVQDIEAVVKKIAEKTAKETAKEVFESVAVEKKEVK